MIYINAEQKCVLLTTICLFQPLNKYTACGHYFNHRPCEYLFSTARILWCVCGGGAYHYYIAMMALSASLFLFSRYLPLAVSLSLSLAFPPLTMSEKKGCCNCGDQAFVCQNSQQLHKQSFTSCLPLQVSGCLCGCTVWCVCCCSLLYLVSFH